MPLCGSLQAPGTRDFWFSGDYGNRRDSRDSIHAAIAANLMDSKKPQYVNIPAKGLKYVGPKDESLESSKSQYEKDLQAATHSGYGIVGDATTKSDYILEDGLAKYVGTKYPPDHFIPKIESFHEFAK
eukprot:1394654-Amorphochlora_amoeboformis.AAC.1